MAKQCSTGTGVVTATTTAQSELVYWIVQAAVAAGWTIKSYGTGTGGSYSSSSAGWSSTSMTANSTRNWVCIEDPAGRRQHTFQIDTSPGGRYGLRAKVSESAKFSGGSPSANVTPSATDEIVIYGGGTDASPAGVSWSAGYPTAHRVHAIADSTPINGVYPLCGYSHLTGTTTVSSLFLADALIAGSYDATDPSPAAWWAGAGFLGSANFWYGYGSGSQAAKTITVASQLCFDATRSADPISGNDNVGRFLYYSSLGPKGYGHWLLLKSQARAYPNNVNRATDCRTNLGAAAAGVLLPSPDATDLVL